MEAKYLKKSIPANVPVNLVLITHKGPYPKTDYVTKQPTGENQWLYIFQNVASGEELKHYASEKDHQTLSLFQKHELVTAILKHKHNDQTNKPMLWVEFHDPKDAAVNSPPQLTSNVQQVAREQHVQKQANDRKLEKRSIIYQAFAKAFIAALGANNNIETVDEFTRKMIEKHDDYLRSLL